MSFLSSASPSSLSPFSSSSSSSSPSLLSSSSSSPSSFSSPSLPSDSTSSTSSSFSEALQKSSSTPPIEALFSLASDLNNVYKNEQAADVRFIVDDQQFYGHKNILALRCPRFKQMFEQQKKSEENNNDSNNDLLVITITNVSATLFNIILTFCYCGDFPDKCQLTASILLNGIKAADYYLLPSFKNACEIELCTYCSSPSIVIDLIKFANLFQTALLKNFCVQHIVNNIAEYNKENFLVLPHNLVKEILDVTMEKKHSSTLFGGQNLSSSSFTIKGNIDTGFWKGFPQI